MDTLIVILVIAAALGLAAFYVIRSKKKGRKCIGCPYADQCSKTCGCGETEKK